MCFYSWRRWFIPRTRGLGVGRLARDVREGGGEVRVRRGVPVMSPVRGSHPPPAGLLELEAGRKCRTLPVLLRRHATKLLFFSLSLDNRLNFLLSGNASELPGLARGSRRGAFLFCFWRNTRLGSSWGRLLVELVLGRGLVCEWANERISGATPASFRARRYFRVETLACAESVKF